MANAVSRQSIIMGMSTAGAARGYQALEGMSQRFKASTASAVSTASGGFSSLASSALKFTGVGALVGTAVGAVTSLGKGFSMASTLEQNQVALETMLGSVDQAKALMGDLNKFASSTPFEFPELADSTKKLVAFGVSTDKIMPSLKSIGDISSGVGANISEIAEIFGKAKVAGTLYAEDINQLVGRGIPVIQEFAKQLGVSEAEVKKMASEGKISFANLEQAFTDLTASGGKFAGMMDKQSKTLGGLMSTLSDSVSMSLANIATEIIAAFNIKDGIAGLSSMVSTAGEWIVSGLRSWLPPIVSGLKTIWDYITSGWAYATGLVRDNLGWISDVLGNYVAGYYSVASGFISGAWSLIQTAASGIYTVVGGVLSWFGVELDTTGVTTQSVMDKIGSWVKWASDGILTGMSIAGWAMRNVVSIVQLVGASFALGCVTMANQVEYAFTQVIPAYLKWFGENWRNILTDVANLSTTVFSNLASNVVGIMSNLPGLISGSVSFNELWTPLTDGFKATMSELPTIAARQAGALEQGLQTEVDGLRNSLGTSLVDALAADQERAKGVSKGIKEKVGGLLAPELPKPPEAPKPQDAPAAAGSGVPTPQPQEKQEDAKEPKAATGGGSGSSSVNENVAVGSALSMRLRDYKLPTAATTGDKAVGGKSSDASAAQGTETKLSTATITGPATLTLTGAVSLNAAGLTAPAAAATPSPIVSQAAPVVAAGGQAPIINQAAPVVKTQAPIVNNVPAPMAVSPVVNVDGPQVKATKGGSASKDVLADLLTKLTAIVINAEKGIKSIDRKTVLATAGGDYL